MRDPAVRSINKSYERKKGFSVVVYLDIHVHNSEISVLDRYFVSSRDGFGRHVQHSDGPATISIPSEMYCHVNVLCPQRSAACATSSFLRQYFLQSQPHVRLKGIYG